MTIAFGQIVFNKDLRIYLMLPSFDALPRDPIVRLPVQDCMHTNRARPRDHSRERLARQAPSSFNAPLIVVFSIYHPQSSCANVFGRVPL